MPITVVVTVKDDPEAERELIAALEKQTVRPDEVIMVRSSHTGRHLETSSRSHPVLKKGIKTRVILAIGCSRGRGRNIGVRKARNEIIAVTDVGCRPQKDWLKRMTVCIASLDLSTSSQLSRDSAQDDLVAVAGWYRVAAKTELQRVMGGFLVPVMEKEREEKKQGDKRGEGKTGEDKILPASRSIMFTKKAWEMVGGYPDEAKSGGEDLEFARRLAADPNIKMIYCPDAVVDWEPPKSLGEFFRDIVKHTRGNVEIMYWPHLLRNLTVVGRWMAIVAWPWLGGIYLIWVLGKLVKLGKLGILERARMAMWLPVVQIVADLGVMVGLVLGIWGKLVKLGKLD